MNDDLVIVICIWNSLFTERIITTYRDVAVTYLQEIKQFNQIPGHRLL